MTKCILLATAWSKHMSDLLDVYNAAGGVFKNGNLSICGGSRKRYKSYIPTAQQSECYSLENGYWKKSGSLERKHDPCGNWRYGPRTAFGYSIFENKIFITGGYRTSTLRGDA